MSDNFREFKSQGEENYSDQTKKSGKDNCNHCNCHSVCRYRGF